VEPADEESPKRAAQPGFGALLESLVASEGEKDRSEDKRRREAENLALCVGLSAVGRQDNGAGEGKPWDKPPDCGASLPQTREISEGETLGQDPRGESGKGANKPIVITNSELDAPADSSFDERRQPADRAMVAILEELVRRLHHASLATRSGAALVVSLGELGEVKIDVRFHGKNMLVRAEVEGPRAAAVLTSAAPELRERLAALGWRLGRLELYERGRAPRVQSAPTEPQRRDESRTVDRAVVAHDGALDVQA
jgi:hypothetical protein